MGVSKQDIERQNKEKAMNDALLALRAAENEQVQQEIFLTLGTEIQAAIAVTGEFSNLKQLEEAEEINISSDPTQLNSHPLPEKPTILPSSSSPDSVTNEAASHLFPRENSDVQPNPTTKPKIEFKGASFENLVALSDNLKSKYSNVKSTQTDSEHIDYAFKHRDCEYSGKVQKNGSGNITIKNAGDWTHRDVEDLVNHIHQDVGSKSVRIAESTVYPLSMLLEACEEFEKRGIAVKVFSGSHTKTIDDIRKEVEESVKDDEQKITHRDFPNEVQEINKYSRLEMQKYGKSISALKAKNAEQLSSNIPNTKTVNSIDEEIEKLNLQFVSEMKQRQEKANKWLRKNPDHVITASVEQNTRDVQDLIDSIEKRIGEAKANKEKIHEVAQIKKQKIIELKDKKICKNSVELVRFADDISFAARKLKDKDPTIEPESFECLKTIANLMKDIGILVQAEPENQTLYFNAGSRQKPT